MSGEMKVELNQEEHTTKWGKVPCVDKISQNNLSNYNKKKTVKIPL